MKRLWKKRLLALFLSASMLLTLVPGAFALGDEDGNSGQSNDVTWKQVDNGAVSASIGREEIEEPEVQPLYDDNEEVRVSIVLEGEPTWALFSLASEDGEDGLSGDAKAYREGLQAYQEAIAEAISDDVLDEPLDVVWNLTLAANIISANVRYGEIEDIKDVEGVEDVIVETRYEVQGRRDDTVDPNMAISTGMTNTVQTWNTGYTGAGMRIAIIDTGLDIEHQSFDNDAFLYALREDAGDENATLNALTGKYDLLNADKIANVLGDLHADIGVSAEELYYNEKIPFRFNYVDGDLDVTHWNDSQGEHGSHVAGIAAANRYLEQEDGSFAPAIDTVKMVGSAPDAQVLVMKVFGKGGGAYDSDYFAAIEDAIALGCDTVNLSLGSGSAGMSFASERYQHIMDGLAGTNTIVTMSAGNSSYWAEMTALGSLYSDDVNYSTASSPGSYTNSLAVASVDNNGMIVGGSIIAYDKSVGYVETSLAPIALLASMDESGSGTDYDFIYIDSFGAILDYFSLDDADVDFTGKIVLVNRGGEIDFTNKANWAVEWADAIAVIICNNEPGSLYMTTEGYNYEVPYVSISLDDANYIKEHAEKHTTEDELDYYTGTLTIHDTPTAFMETPDHMTVSSFSSWGVPGDLSIKPEISAPGGAIWSLNGLGTDHASYESMSGTSMAAPQMAGIGALVKQSIEDKGYSARTDITDRALVQSLTMSTATPLKDAGGRYYPVFQQGAGMVDTLAAVNADSYILMSSDATASHNDGKVKVELGDDPGRTGAYSFTFTINNLKNVPLSYTLDADVFTQAYAYDEGTAHNYLLTSTMPLTADFDYTVVSATVGASGTKYDFDGNGVVDEDDGNALLDFVTGKRQSIFHQENADMSGDGKVSSYDGYVFLQDRSASAGQVNVPANGSVTIRATIELDQAGMAEIMQDCPNGVYVEGYVKVNTVASEEGALGTSHSIPVLGFYGSWTDPSMYERGNALDYIFDLEKGDDDAFFETLEKLGYPYLWDETSTSLFANRLMYQKDGDKTNYYYGGNPYISDDEYLPERNAFSSTRGDKFVRWNYMAIRNAAAGRLLIENAVNGTVYEEIDLGTITAAYFHPNAGNWYNTSSIASIGWSGTDANGKALTDGTEVRMSLTLAPELYRKDDGSIDWDALGDGASQTIIFTIDNTVPQLRNAAYNAATKTLTLTVQDNLYTAYAAITSADGTRILGKKSPNQAVVDKGRAVTVDFDMSNIVGTELKVVLGDYANNQVTYELKGKFDPGMDLTPDIDAYYYGYNQVSGEWVAYNKAGTEYAVVGYGLNTIAGDLDNAFLTAGAYARGYVFASDDGSSFYAFPVDEETSMIGGGQWISSVGLVYDMAYDGTDMYLSYEGYEYVDDGDFGGFDDDDPGFAVDSGAGARSMEPVIKLGKVDLLTGELTEIGRLSGDEGFNYSCALAFDDNGGLYELEYYEFYNENWELDAAAVLNKLTVGADSITKAKIAEVDAAGDSFNWLTWDSNEDELVLSAGDAYYGEYTGYEFINNLYTVDPATGEATLVAELTPNRQQLTALFVTPDGEDKFPSSTDATTLTLSETSMYVAPGASEQLTALVRPWNLTNRSVTWSSSNPAVVSVDQSGNIRARSPGTAVITAASSATPSVKAACEIEVAKLDQQLNALIWTDHVDWATFPVTDPAGWEPIHESDKVFASATVGEDGYIYAATLNESNATSDLYQVDPNTYKSALVGTVGGELFTADLAVIPGTGHLLGLYGNYILEIDSENAELIGAWDVSDWGWQTYMVAAAYLGESTMTGQDGWIYDEETDEYYPNEVEYDVHVYALIDVYGGIFYFACTDEGDGWFDMYGNGETDYVSDELWYSSAVWAYNSENKPTLFWSYYNSDVSSELLAISLDDSRLTASLLGGFGEFGANAWPVVGLMTTDTPDLPESAAAMLNSGSMKQVSAAQTVRKISDKAAAAAENYEEADVFETRSMSAESNSSTSTVSNSLVTAQVTLDKASANGLIEVTYDVNELELIRVTGKATINSANTTEDGKVTLAYAYAEAAEEGTVVATLMFNSKTMRSTTVRMTTREDGLETPNTSVLVPVTFVVDEDPVYIPTPGGNRPGGGGSSGGGTTTKPVEEPTKPVEEPTNPVEEPVTPVVPVNPSPSQFVDVPAGAWYAEYVDYVVGHGLMNGTSATTFAPDDSLTRAMLVTILHRSAGQPNAGGSISFSDVAAGSWYEAGVNWAAINSLVNGYGDGRFGPNGNITRQELAVILWRYAQMLGISVAADGTTIPDFVDRDEIAPWAAEAMSWAYRTGIITGRDSTHLAPNGGASRVEAAAMLVRFLKLVERSLGPSV